MYDRVDISQLKNKIFSKVYRTGDFIFFENSKEKYALRHDQNCCEDVYIDDVCGELSNLENAEITYAEKTTNEGFPKNEYDNSCTWTFFKFATNKGWVDVRFYGTSNGYYSEDADLYLVEKKEDEIFMNPVYETKINRAVFFNQEIVVYPNRDADYPENLVEAVRFLFGEGARVREDFTNGYPSFTITGANYELRNAITKCADWTYTKVDE